MLSKVDRPDVRRQINLLRGKANEFMDNSAIYMKAPEPINFDAYKKQLKFTAAAVDALQKVDKNKSLPTYHASLPSVEVKKREMMASVIEKISELARADIEESKAQLEELEKVRITPETTVDDLNARFPQFGRDIEKEIDTVQWSKSVV